MKNIFLTTLALTFITTTLQATQWTWTAHELIGTDTHPKQTLTAKAPIQIGAPYEHDKDLWQKWCDDIKESFGFFYARCSSVRYANFEAYLTIDVVPMDQKHRAQFRLITPKKTQLASASILALHKRLKDRLWELFEQGTPPKETWQDGYLQYDDPVMQDCATKLRRAAPRFKNNVIQVLAHHEDPSVRMTAADLLNWVGDGPQVVGQVHKFLDDPHSGVRNQLARFMMYPITEVQSDAVAKQVLGSLALLLERPAHGDRNKALYNLLALAKSKPHLRPEIFQKAGAFLEHLADKSILSNIKDPAKQLLNLL